MQIDSVIYPILLIFKYISVGVIMFAILMCRESIVRKMRRLQPIETTQLPSKLVAQVVVHRRRRPSHQEEDATRTITLSGTYAIYEKLIEATRCGECMKEMEDDEDDCRVLFRCKHQYHRLCIDQRRLRDWHCPLCHGFAQTSE